MRVRLLAVCFTCIYARWSVVCASVHASVSTCARVCDGGELRGCGQSDALPWNREGPDPTGIEREPLHLTPLASVTGGRWIIGISTPPGIKCFNYDYYRNATEWCRACTRYSRLQTATRDSSLHIAGCRFGKNWWPARFTTGGYELSSQLMKFIRRCSNFLYLSASPPSTRFKYTIVPVDVCFYQRYKNSVGNVNFQKSHSQHFLFFIAVKRTFKRSVKRSTAYTRLVNNPAVQMK